MEALCFDVICFCFCFFGFFFSDAATCVALGVVGGWGNIGIFSMRYLGFTHRLLRRQPI